MEESETNQPTDQKLPYPKHVWLILVNEVCERFCFYGLRTLLVLYIRNTLLYTEPTAKVVVHSFQALCYFFPLFGAIIADSWMGKFNTILYLSIVYVIGTGLLSFSAMPFSWMPQFGLCLLGLFLIAMGTGGIKPCVSSFGGDQFIIPQQSQLLDRFFTFFYFSINIGSTAATITTPLLRERVWCFGDKSCYSLGFGIPAILMAAALGIFVIGKPLYRIVRPTSNVVWWWLRCVCNALGKKIRSKEKVPHWLDHSNDHFGEKFVSEVKQTFCILTIIFPLFLFWTLFDQTTTVWILQGDLMDNELGSYSIPPEQMITANSAMILIFLPLFSYCVYPLCAKCNFITTPLQKIACGGFTAAIAFFISACLSLGIEGSLPVLPQAGECFVNIYNPLPCDARISAKPHLSTKQVRSMSLEQIKLESVSEDVNVVYEISGCEDVITSRNGTDFQAKEKMVFGYFLTVNGLKKFTDDPERNRNGNPKIRTLLGNANDTIELSYLYENKKVLTFKSTNISAFELDPGSYSLENFPLQFKLHKGGVYTVLAYLSDTDKLISLHTITQPNKVHLLWQLIPYATLTAGEVLLSPTALEFAYTQAPISMKSLMTAMWLLTVAIGNVFVVIFASIFRSNKASLDLFIFGILMVLDMLFFVFLATRYKYVEFKSSEDNDQPQ